MSRWPVVGRFECILTSVPKRYKSFVSNFAESTVCFHHMGQTDREVNYDECESHLKHMNIVCGQNAELLNVTADGTHNYH